MALPDGLKATDNPGVYEARIKIKVGGKVVVDTQRKIKAPNEATAIRAFIKLQDELRAGAKVDEWTVSEALDAWMAQQLKASFNSWNGRKSHADSMREAFGTRKLSKVSRQEWQRWIVDNPNGHVTANAYRGSMISMYRFADNEGRLVGEVPMTYRRKDPRDSQRDKEASEQAPPKRALLGDELRRFFAAVDEVAPEMYVMARVMLLLGCRWAEAAALQWAHIDWDTGVVNICRSLMRNGDDKLPKNRSPRFAALGSIGLEMMMEHRAAMAADGRPGSTVYCFPRPISTGKGRPYSTPGHMWTYGVAAHRWEKVFARCGIEADSLTHSLRHSHASIVEALQSDEISRASLQTMGHASNATHGGYVDRKTKEKISRGTAATYASKVSDALTGGGETGGEEPENTPHSPLN